jgi:hypothetical protein
MSDRNGDWSALAADWQRQATPVLDIEALRREVDRRGRTLRYMVWLEIGFTLLVLGACAMIVLSPHSERSEAILFGAMAVFLLVYQTGIVWMRRRDLANTGRDARSLVDLEIRRAGTVLLYWRWGMWAGLALWVVLYGFFMAGVLQGWPSPRLAGLAGGLLVNVVVFPAVGVYAWWRCRQARARLARFHALREQLTQ